MQRSYVQLDKLCRSIIFIFCGIYLLSCDKADIEKNRELIADADRARISDVNRLNNKIEDLELRLEEAESKIDTLESRNSELESDILDLESKLNRR